MVKIKGFIQGKERLNDELLEKVSGGESLFDGFDDVLEFDDPFVRCPYCGVSYDPSFEKHECKISYDFLKEPSFRF